MKNLVAFTALLSLAFIFSCGKQPRASYALRVSGKAVAGEIRGGTVTAYEFTSSATNGKTLAVTTTRSDGSFVFSDEVSSPTGIFLVEVKGGKYYRESAPTSEVTLDKIEVLLSNPDLGSKTYITPISRMHATRVRRVIQDTGLAFTGDEIDSINTAALQEIASAFGVSKSVFLEKPTVTARGANTHYLLLATLDQLSKDEGTDPNSAISDLATDFADAVLTNNFRDRVRNAWTAFSAGNGSALGMGSPPEIDATPAQATGPVMQAILISKGHDSGDGVLGRLLKTPHLNSHGWYDSGKAQRFANRRPQ